MAPVAVPTMTKNSLPDGRQKYRDPSAAAALSTTWRPTKSRNPLKRDAFSFDSMEDALKSFAAGEFLVVMDDENRENEGDLIIAASQCTTEKMAWMIKHTRYAKSLSLKPTLISVQWLRLHCPPRKPARRAQHPHDGPRKSGQTSHRLYHHSGLQTRSVFA
jgi:3,4-dihydroxy 2-butanone 4-phosphate synthase